MKTIKVIIEKAESNYCAYLEGIDGIVAVGYSIEEIKANMCISIQVLKDECEEHGYEFPEELQGEYELVYQMDVKSLLEFYSGIFTKAGLERITGINQKQLWHYASGGRKPRPEQVLKIETALHKLGQDLLAINL
jgi:predicted RNase H-like HicB family nuclease